MRIVTRIGPFSAFKVGGFLYACLGLVLGALFSLFSLVGFLASRTNQQPGAFGFLFGTLAIVFLPIIYGVMGAISSALMALLHNLCVQFTGGVEVEVS